MIQFTTVNVDGAEVTRTFASKEELKKEWLSDNCDLPAGDDRVVCAEADGLVLRSPRVFDDLLFILGITSD